VGIAATRAALADDDGVGQRADVADRCERVLDAGGDVQLLLGADDELAIGQYRGERVRDPFRARVAGLARGMPADTPQIRPIVDVEDDGASVRLGDIHGLALGARGGGQGEVRTGNQDGVRGSDERLVDVALGESAVGAVLAVEDQRKGLRIAHTEEYEGGEALRIDVHAGGLDAFAGELLTYEASHRLISHAGDERRAQSKPCRADGNIRRAPADGFGEGRDVLQAAADLLSVQIDTHTPDRDEIQ